MLSSYWIEIKRNQLIWKGTLVIIYWYIVLGKCLFYVIQNVHCTMIKGKILFFFVAKECSNSLLDPLFFFRTSLLNHLPAWQSFDMRQMPVVAKIRPLKSQSWWWLQLCCGTLLLIKSTDNKNWPSNVKTTWWRKKKGGRMLRKKTFSSCAEKRDITIIIACRAIYT